MIDLFLQFGVRSSGTISLALTLTSSVLGLAVGYIAFRGYRRNRSLPMLFVATGFLLAFWTPVLLLGGFVLAGEVGQFAPGLRGTVNSAFGIAGDVSKIIGLLCILYGLRMPLSR
jgi:hypothetical protein